MSSRCLACPSGKFSAPLIDTIGSTFVCEECPAGTSQPSGGQQQCEPCGQGEYQDLTGQFTCNRCPVGYYEDPLLNVLGMAVNSQVSKGSKGFDLITQVEAHP